MTLEAGKIVSEGLGEVQEMIDICDFAVGLSRQLHGLTIASERPGHRMMETWHPLGPCAIISAFNFPVAVWAWNAALALVCGDPVIWKPSEKTPLTAPGDAESSTARPALRPDAPAGLAQVVIGGPAIGEALVADPPRSAGLGHRLDPHGLDAGAEVAARFGRAILELGGNNAMIVAPSADLDLAMRAIVFSAVGTAGQRCTSLRRLFVHFDSPDAHPRLSTAYAELPDRRSAQGRDAGRSADRRMSRATDAGRARARQGRRRPVIHGGRTVAEGAPNGGAYVEPAIVEMPGQTAIVRERDLRPDPLCDAATSDLADAIALHNAVPQGLSSSIFTLNMREADTFLSAAGSDCGIANVNIGPSGAEIGGAFGGEKETGGGRESGSDAWKAYMRRQTSTVNYSARLPLAQGVRFDF